MITGEIQLMARNGLLDVELDSRWVGGDQVRAFSLAECGVCHSSQAPDAVMQTLLSIRLVTGYSQD